MSGQAVTWRAAPRLRRLATVSLIGLAAAVTGRASLLLLAAPALAVLSVSRGRAGLATVEAEAVTSASRCFESEDIELTVTVVSPPCSPCRQPPRRGSFSSGWPQPSRPAGWPAAAAALAALS